MNESVTLHLKIASGQIENACLRKHEIGSISPVLNSQIIQCLVVPGIVKYSFFFTFTIQDLDFLS